MVKEVAAAAETAVVVTRYPSEGAFLGEKGSVPVGLEACQWRSTGSMTEEHMRMRGAYHFQTRFDGPSKSKKAML